MLSSHIDAQKGAPSTSAQANEQAQAVVAEATGAAEAVKTVEVAETATETAEKPTKTPPPTPLHPGLFICFE